MGLEGEETGMGGGCIAWTGGCVVEAAGMKRVSLLLALLGVGVVGLLLAWFDVGAVWAAMRSVGWVGFLVLVGWQGVLFVVLGGAWRVVMPGVGLGLMVWGRMVRDAATTCLPFSPVGGYVVGARALTLEGVAWPRAAAGTVVDVTGELSAQLVFSVFGVLVLVLVRPGSGLAGPAAVGVGAAAALLAAGVWRRRRIGGVLRGLGRRLLGDWFSGQVGVGLLELSWGRCSCRGGCRGGGDAFGGVDRDGGVDLDQLAVVGGGGGSAACAGTRGRCWRRWWRRRLWCRGGQGCRRPGMWGWGRCSGCRRSWRWGFRCCGGGRTCVGGCRS